MDDRLRATVAASHLRDLPGDVMSALIEGARRFTVPAGHRLHRADDGVRHVELVVQGLTTAGCGESPDHFGGQRSDERT